MCKIFALFETFESFESIRGVAVSTSDCRAEDPWFDSSFAKSVLISSRRLHCANASHFESFIQRKATSTCRIVRTLVSRPNKTHIDKCEDVERQFVHSRRLFLGIF